jgi:hypothetical protein
VAGLGQPAGVDVRVRGRGEDGERLQERCGLGGHGTVLVPQAVAVLAARGHQADAEAALDQVDRDGGRDGHGSLERRGGAGPAMCAGAVVQEQRGPRLPRLLLASDHQLAGMGAAAPVHPTKVVAPPVLTDGDVLRAAAGEGAGPVVPGARPGPGERDRRQRQHRRGDHERRGALERAIDLHQPERIPEPDLHGADVEPTAHVRADVVGHRARPPRPHPVDHEPRARAEHDGHLLLEQQEAGRHPAVVAEVELDGGLLAGADLGRGHRAHQAEAVAAASDEEHGRQREQRQEGSDPDELVVPQEEGTHQRGATGGQERPPTGGQAGESLTHGGRGCASASLGWSSVSLRPALRWRSAGSRASRHRR